MLKPEKDGCGGGKFKEMRRRGKPIPTLKLSKIASFPPKIIVFKVFALVKIT